jgi:hypothetical protein
VCAVLLHGELLQVILLPEGGSSTVDMGGEDLHCVCSPSSWTTFLKVVLLPEGGSGTVDKGGEDLHCAVFLHRELLKVV